MNFDDRMPVTVVKALVDQHGLWRVLREAARAVLLRPARVRVLHVDMLSDHLRRDIGLPPRSGGPADWN